MKETGRETRAAVSGILLVFFVFFLAPETFGNTCEEGRGMPPFLGGEVVTPNILLMIDNSASMYDPAYVDENALGYCFDEGYDNTRTYAGYFMEQDSAGADVWYKYDNDPAANQFKVIGDKSAAETFCNSAVGTKYNHPDNTVAEPSELCITVNEAVDPNVVNAFAATGKLLNWLSASKMDIQKSVLTGGKYDQGDAELIMEARGCQGKRLVKRLGVNGATGGFLSMSIRGDDSTHQTIIEIYEITDTGYENTNCYDVLTMLIGEDLDPECNVGDAGYPDCPFNELDFDSDPKLGALKKAVNACLGDPKQNSEAGASNSAFNTALHYCWYQAKHEREPPGSGHVNSVKNACENVYPDKFDVGVNPWDITDDMSSFICSGNYLLKSDPNFEGYVGNCWEPVPVSAGLDETGSQTLLAESRYGAGSLPVAEPDLATANAELQQAVQDFIRAAGDKNRERFQVLRALRSFLVAEAHAYTISTTPLSVDDDHGSPAYEETGTAWANHNKGVNGSSRTSDLTGDTAVWTPTIATSGIYEVKVRTWLPEPSHKMTTAAEYVVTHSLGTSNVIVINQNSSGPKDLGQFYFRAGDTVSVSLRVAEDKPTSADEVTWALLENYDPAICEVAPAATVFLASSYNALGSDFGDHSSHALDHIHAGDSNGSEAGDNDLDFEYPGSSVEYKVNFVHPGTYYLWLNVAANNGNDNSLWYGLDDNKIGNISTQPDATGAFPTTQHWINKNFVPAGHSDPTIFGPIRAQVVIATPGEHVINLWGREKGFKVYKIGLTMDPNVTGPVVGQVISPSTCSGVVGPPGPKGDYQWLQPDSGPGDAGYDCVAEGLNNFCEFLNVPGEPDPSDQQALAGNGSYWNAPPVVTDLGLSAQLGEPLTNGTMYGSVEQTTAPSGVIQKYNDQVRLGIMAFRDKGDGTECNGGNPSYPLFCYDTTDTIDGSYILVPVDKYDGVHDPVKTIDKVVDRINDLKASTWTPLAEAMYTAVGYFGERGADATAGTDFRLNTAVSGDFRYIRDYDVTPYAPVWEDQEDYPADAVVMYDNGYWKTTAGGFSEDNPDTLQTGPSDDIGVAWATLSVDTDATGVWNDSTTYTAGEIVIYNNRFFKAYAEVSASATDPITDAGTNWLEVSGPNYASCQSNNVIIITEGSSTADVNSKVTGFNFSTDDGDTDNTTGCDVLKGTTLFDDFAGYGQEAENLYALEPFGSAAINKKDPINTHIVYTGTRRIGVSSTLEPECNPETLLDEAAAAGGPDDFKTVHDGEEPDDLRESLDDLFSSILTRTSSGSAASVISSSNEGEGALYQALFWPDTDTNMDDTVTGEDIYVSWTGEVHSFLIDSQGILYLDSYPGPAGDGALQVPEDTDADGEKDILDEPVIVYFDENLKETKACIGHIKANDPGIDDDEIVFFDETTGACSDGLTDLTKELDEINYLWNTSDWLNSSDVNSFILDQRPLDADDNFDFTGDNKYKRYIFTWNDRNNDGVVDPDIVFPADSEIRPFIEDLGGSAGMPDETTGTGRLPLEADFGVDMTDLPGSPLLHDPTHMANRIIKWVRGEDQGEETFGTVTFPEMRSREMKPKDTDGDDDIDEFDTSIYWKLGDVVHSTPILVARPAENYHLLYRDFTYAQFVNHYANRRQMIYFGANDGMLHAVNGGFFKQKAECPSTPPVEQKRFCLTKDCVLDSNCAENNATDVPALGAEMWAYVPYNLLPHLKCLTEPGYTGDEHKYFVDLRPRIFDVQIYPEICDPTNTDYDEDHPCGWATILVGGMRFGGSPTSLDPLVDVNNDGTGDIPDNRIFTSAYFILDISNPEKPPVLLGEFTKTSESDEDIDGDNHLDVAEDLDGDNHLDTDEDLNDDGILDPGEDLDGDGLETVNEDVDGDGNLDVDEDVNGNGILDYEEVDLGYTTVISTMVPYKVNPEKVFDDVGNELSSVDRNCDNSETIGPGISKWYLILGSGPTELDGTSDMVGSVSVVPLERLVGSTPKDMRIPALEPNNVEEMGTFKLPNLSSTDDNSFISDLITVDMQTQSDYQADVVYFGTVSGDWSSGWGGKLYRMIVHDWRSDATGRICQLPSPPSTWASLYENPPSPAIATPFIPLLDVQQPVTSSPTVGTDGIDFWVYFGTGRFFHADDKINVYSNALQSYYGIREPVSNNILDLNFTGTGTQAAQPHCQLTWSQVWNNAEHLGTATGGTQPNGNVLTAGHRAFLGIERVDKIDILSTTYIDEPNTLACKDGTTDCLDTPALDDPLFDVVGGVTTTGTFQDLIDYITGDHVQCVGSDMGKDGWYREFPDSRERNLGQASLLGGLLSFTTYRPYINLCQEEGLGYLYGAYYQTGTAWHEDVFGTVVSSSPPTDVNPERMGLGIGLATTPNIHVGDEDGGKAFMVTSVGRIVEIPQPNLPSKTVKSGRVKWRDIEQ